MLKIFRFFRWYHWVFTLLIFVFIYLQVQFDLKLIDYMGNIIRIIGNASSTGTSQTPAIIDEGLMMLLVTFGSITMTIIASFFAARVGTKVANIMRKSLFSHVQGFSLEEVNKFSTASLITRTTNDVQQVQMALIIMLRMLVRAPIMAVAAILKVTDLNLTMSLVVVFGIVAIIVMIGTIFYFVGPKFSLLQKRTDDLNEVTRETLTGIRVIRSHHAETIQENKFEGVNEKLTKTHIFVNTAMSFLNPGMTIVFNGLNLSLIVVGAVLISTNSLGATPIEGLAIQLQFISYGMMIMMSFMMLIMMFIFLPRAWVSANRIMEVINTPFKINDAKANNIDPRGVSVEFKNVCFKYPDADECVIRNISFKGTKGQTLAFIGSTGSGKSTIIQLLLRFYDVTEGEILVNSKNIQEYPLEELYKLMGYVPQKGILFSGDILSNMRIANPDATEEEILKALEIAQIKDYALSSDEGLAKEIDQGGKNVSGGQKQRLSIARALVKNAPIYIFDDSFSALDYRTDKTLRKALKTEVKDALNIIVGQRIGTIMDADQIIVLDKGDMVCKGTHKDLLETCPTYQETAYAQLSKEELANG
ncbi:ABC transporter ATP-binding protein [Mariniplasma anaerobium]|uniref:Multidrug ABC transporter ATP-binding protein n=1 Tax=Mariniplasma anaerobium TaxID=2735436 RepID=A0A7U9XV77_9MOLU|nr:ABC transporter ATP-binding protein [Mariniplasma anaerobium]BCR35872.1 multidrug ABC transporter ATP-binding protein [Mariniplasma anaerobium]